MATVKISTAAAAVERTITTGFDETGRAALAIAACVDAMDALQASRPGATLRQQLLRELTRGAVVQQPQRPT